MKEQKINFAIGGQAIIEGVMMRSPKHYVMAVRRANQKIVVEVRKYVSYTKRSKIAGLPLIRGIIVLAESLTLGMKALVFSNNIMLEDLEKENLANKKKSTEKPNQKVAKKPKESRIGDLAKNIFMILYFIFIFLVAIFLFKFIPLLVAQWVNNHSILVSTHYLLFNLIDGLTKIVIFTSYVLLISLVPDIRRVFAYHGAEHQAIWTYEHENPLTIKNAQNEHPEHPRCGTSFIMLVLLVSILIYTILPPGAIFMVKLLERIAVLPLIAGLSYEILKVSAKYEQHWWMQWVTIPGLLLQKITTSKPTDEMQEVALESLKAALKVEGKSLIYKI
ncbi:MAG: hypothetical protein UT55_C0049G0003 [Candidatus Peregrinibacteria bacterium GW2011_GWE2_39_6]|nr:MAG: hypothetical protein UT36_C0003G0074 [Candidatus Peregrinibacteria bacterium GW2011_GWF2_39_17]KKR25127.1 MAG: hypothetical protein UT55_C0049G0003 [Candidatus Peregrinibacteria bacterium GW2011_GWE2_39_6]HCW31964.1 DUF1385 domain-containing protein [Candidatus Peregrinibacteria bacterium]